MPRTFHCLSLAVLLTTGAATAMAAGADVTSQSMTGTQTGSQQVGTPATGGDYRTSTQSVAPTYAYPNGATGMNAQSGQYPGKVGPTGSNQPDATNPNRSSPTGGGSQESSSGGSGTSTR